VTWRSVVMLAVGVVLGFVVGVLAVQWLFNAVGPLL
jgi:undecaprenyl pyrophosphate phosphatase UppP